MRIIAGTHKNRILTVPKGSQTRPTAERLRETLFNICQNYVEGSRFLDLFAGSGAIGFEALSRGAVSCTLVDSSKECQRCMKFNAQAFPDSDVDVICADVISTLKGFISDKRKFDIIYIDPPYGNSMFQEGKRSTYSAYLLGLIDQSELLSEGGMLFIEDLQNSLSKEIELAKLKLISHRRAGRAWLFQFSK